MASAAGFGGALIKDYFIDEPQITYVQKESDYRNQVSQASSKVAAAGGEDFVLASSLATASVVYIKTVTTSDYEYNTFDWFFGGQESNQSASAGSGVIYSNEGYIITNNHVIEKSDKIEVVHGKKTYQASIVGRDPSTDLAVLKVNGAQLPAIKLGTSKNLRVGEWVLAVGNPFNLTSTVTAGIISAKARNINVVNSQFPIESFIQTDAAINPGNSGGALINTRGELIGINTAILSRTGSYTGYGFAVPVDIVSKVVKDLIEFGEVQKAFTGLEVGEITNDIAARLKLEDPSGVVVNYIQNQGSAEKAGIKKGDVILKIDEAAIDSKSTYDEQMSYYSPGEKIKISYKNADGLQQAMLTLTNREGTTDVLRKETVSSKTLGADLEIVSKVEKDKLGITSGVRILKIKNGLIRRLGISEGFIVTNINKVPVQTVEGLVDILEKIRGKVIIEGIAANGVRGYYTYYF